MAFMENNHDYYPLKVQRQKQFERLESGQAS